MKDTTKLPKTFIIYAERLGKGGYLRFRSYVTDGGDIDYGLSMARKASEASRYVTLDNSKAKAKALKDRYGFDVVNVIDEASKKTYVIH